MNIALTRGAKLCSALLVFVHFTLQSQPLQASLSNDELIRDLQAGGHIIYMRHAKTNHNKKDKGQDRLDSCDKQRNLSEEGRQQARLIGRVIQSYQVPIGQVFSSPYCRCKETAQLTFGKMTVENDLQFSISKAQDESQMLGERLKALMLKSVANKKNTVFVGHTSNLKDAMGIWPKPEGVLVIFKKIDNDLIYKGMLKPSFFEHAR